jgi:hypothetical protein
MRSSSWKITESFGSIEKKEGPVKEMKTVKSEQITEESFSFDNR